MSQTRPKPQAILDLEQRYSITIYDQSEQATPWSSDCYYKCNEEGEVISLQLRNCDLTEIPNLNQCVKLTYLDLSGNQISELKGLDQLTSLTDLDLSSNQITESNGLCNLLDLRCLYLHNNQIIELSGLDQLTNLKYLYLGSNKIIEIKGLDHLTSLEILYLSGNQITEIKGLNCLTNLTSLYLWGNNITEIKGLNQLINLEELSLGNNKIFKINGLDGLMGLIDLDLSSNHITKLRGLDSLVRLKKLKLQNNKIPRIKGLKELSQLSFVDLSNNRISRKSDLEKLNQIKEFKAESNPIKEDQNHLGNIRNLASKLKNFLIANRWLWLSASIWIFIWGVLGHWFTDIFDDYLLPILRNTSQHPVYIWSSGLISVYLIYRIIQLMMLNYRVPSPVLSLGFFFCIIYWVNRRAYIAHPNIILDIGYGDIFIFLLSICVISLFFSQMRRSCHIQNLQEHYSSEFTDTPVSSSQDDRLDYKPIAQKLSKEILSLNAYFYSYSIGIIAPWGSGKTSFLNMLKESLNSKIKRQELLLVEFNPRLSKNAAHIQEDFFSLFFSALGKYDLRFSSVFHKYLQAIDVVAKSSIFSLKLSSLIDREVEKKHINQAIKEINKPIVVLIDDLDRLLADEIQEVFKLIRGNADFFNVLFVVAYDKDYVNRMLQKILYNQDLNFTDKFCSREITLPLRPYRILIKELAQGLLVAFENDDKLRAAIAPNIDNSDDKLRAEMVETIKELEYHLPRYLSTMRDIKRFLHSFIPAFREIKNDLLFRDYFILQLIKQKSYSCYTDLMNGTLTHLEGDMYHLNDELPSDHSCLDLLKLLLSPAEDYHSRSICRVRSFHLYFYESPYGIVKREDLESLIVKHPSRYEVTQYIDDKLKEYEVAHIIDALRVYERDHWTADQLRVYLSLIFYLESIDSRNTYLKLSMTSPIRLKSNAETMQIDETTYKSAFLYALWNIGLSTGYNAVEEDLGNFILGRVTKDDCILTINEMKEVSRELFKAAFREKRLSPYEIIKLWRACLDGKDSQNPDYILLDKNVRQLLGNKVKDEPHEYLEYLFTGGEEGEVQINVFWEQVLSREDLEGLVVQYTGNKHQEIKDYWERFKGNGYRKVDSNGKMI